MSSYGEKLLYKLVLGQDMEAYKAAQLCHEWFVGTETGMYKHIEEHVQKYNVLEKPSTLYEYFDKFKDMPAPEEPIEFFRDKVIARYKHTVLQIAALDVGKHLNNKQVAEAEGVWEEARRKLAKLEQGSHGMLFHVDMNETLMYSNTEPEPITCCVEDFLEEGVVGLLGGPGAAGKSRTAMQVGLSKASGAPLFANPENGLAGFEVIHPGEVIYLACEDSKKSIHRRYRAIIDGFTPEQQALVHQNFYMESMTMADMRLLTQSKAGLTSTPTWNKLLASLRSRPNLSMLIIEPLSMLNGGDENTSGDMTQLLSMFNAVRDEFKCTVIICAHTNKAASTTKYAPPSINDFRGSNASVMAARWAAILCKMHIDEAKPCGVTPESCKYYAKIVILKWNDGPPETIGTPIWLRQNMNGVFQRVDFDAVSVKESMHHKIAGHVESLAKDGKYMSKTSFAAHFGGVNGMFGISAKQLITEIDDAIAIHVISEILPPIKGKGLKKVLAVLPKFVPKEEDDF